MERKSKKEDYTTSVKDAIVPVQESKAALDEPPLIQWQKNGPGSLRLKTGKIIKQNEVFWARESDISVAFRKCVSPVDADAYIAEKERPLELERATYTIEACSDDQTRFNVVNHAGKVINEKPLSLEEAEDLVEALKK